MKWNEKISIAMCTFNGARFLDEQLESIAGQTVHPHELVICDDGSSDGSVDLVNRFANRAAFSVRFYANDHNLGPTKNFEKAIQLCRGDWIALADQDDVWHPQKLERIGKAFARSSDVGAVLNDAAVVDENLLPLGYRMWERVRFTPREQRLFRRGRALDVLLKHYVVTGAAFAFAAVFKDRVLPIPGYWFHDAWIAVLIAATSRIELIEDPLIQYRQHSANQIGGRRQTFFMDLKDGLKAVREDYYRVELERYEALYDRCRKKVQEGDGAVLSIAEKLDHLKTRAAMPRERRRRLYPILREVLSGRYSRYARNWRSVAVDLFYPVRGFSGSRA